MFCAVYYRVMNFVLNCDLQLNTEDVSLCSSYWYVLSHDLGKKLGSDIKGHFVCMGNNMISKAIWQY